MKLRLNKYLANAGVASRRHADEFILDGKVSVNGKIVNELGVQIETDHDVVFFDGSAVKPFADFAYYALNKPKGVISTSIDEIGRKKVTDLVPEIPRVYPIGRLDAESEGLIVLTNDGTFTQKLTHPSFKHEKEYIVTVKKLESSRVGKDGIKSVFEKGMLIDGIQMKADKVALHDTSINNVFTLNIVLHTGYNRQIRKMCAKINLEVLKLERVRIGKLKLSDLELKSGEYTTITKEQIL